MVVRIHYRATCDRQFGARQVFFPLWQRRRCTAHTLYAGGVGRQKIATHICGRESCPNSVSFLAVRQTGRLASKTCVALAACSVFVCSCPFRRCVVAVNAQTTTTKTDNEKSATSTTSPEEKCSRNLSINLDTHTHTIEIRQENRANTQTHTHTQTYRKPYRASRDATDQPTYSANRTHRAMLAPLFAQT